MDFNFHVIAIVLYMMELLPTRSTFRLTHIKHLKRRQGKEPCLSGKWFQFGSFRFWQRKPCHIMRRQKEDKKPTTTPSLPKPGAGIDLDDLPSLEPGPKRSPFYDPNYGYEPYWADGDWVFDKRPDDKTNPLFMCGTRCSKVYIEYGAVCARDKNYKRRTFDNYCAMKSEDCSGIERWMVVYRGECFRDLTVYNRHYLQSRVRHIINTFLDRNDFTESWMGYCPDGPGSSRKP